MPFLLYACTAQRAVERVYKRLQRVSLAGNGPIASYVGTEIGTSKPEWQLPEEQLLQRLGVSPDGHALVVDLKPQDEERVSLYRLRDLWGYYYGEAEDAWTPLLLRLEVLYADKKVENPANFKEEFSDSEAEQVSVYEFLYLYRTKNGTWSWGRNGSVNATLLFPEALDYFLRILHNATSLKAAG